MTYTLMQLEAIDIFGKYIPPTSKNKDWTKDIPHLEDVFRVAEEKWGVPVELYYSSEKKYVLWLNEDISIDYNPFLSLLEQDEKTLKEFIEKFANNK